MPGPFSSAFPVPTQPKSFLTPEDVQDSVAAGVTAALAPPTIPEDKISSTADIIRSLPEVQAQQETVDTLGQLIAKQGVPQPGPTNISGPLAGLTNYLQGGPLNLPAPPPGPNATAAISALEGLAKNRNALTETLLSGLKLAGKATKATATKPLTENQAKNAGWAVKAEQAERTLENLPPGFDPTSVQNAFIGNKFTPDLFKDPAQKAYAQAIQVAINASLRRDSGAAISRTEFANEYDLVGAGPNDDEITSEQKRQTRIANIASYKAAAGDEGMQQTYAQLAKSNRQFNAGKIKAPKALAPKDIISEKNKLNAIRQRMNELQKGNK